MSTKSTKTNNTTLTTPETKKIVYTKKDLIKLAYDYLIKNECPHLPLELITQIINAYQISINKVLMQADENTNITAKIFDGIRFDTSYVPARRNNLYRGKKFTKERIKVKTTISRTFKDTVLNNNLMGWRK